MRFGLTADQEKWRDDVRRFINGSSMPTAFTHWITAYQEAGTAEGQAWRVSLGERGWLTPSLPKEYGGQGLGYVEQWILFDEISRAGLPKVGTAAAMIAPILMRVASDEMKAEWLPRIASGEVDFALGYSEPEAGTDLANLRTAAVENGDEFVINGSKLWNSAGHVATHEWLAVRTDPTASKHQGISLIIVPMDSPGLEVRPIWTWSDHRTNEVFFDDVRVPKANLVGELNQGWNYIVHALGTERLATGETGDLLRFLDMVIAHVNTASRQGRRLSEDPLLRQAIARLESEIHAGRLMSLRIATNLDEGAEVSYETSALKIWLTELRQRLSGTLVSLLGMSGQLRPEDPLAPLGGLAEIGVRDATRLTFTAGANEVLRDIVAVRGLGLPRGKKVQSDSELGQAVPSGLTKLGLTEIQQELVQIARRFRRDALSSEGLRPILLSETGHLDSLWKSIAGMGWIGLSLPEDVGGAGATFSDLAVVAEELGRGLVPNSFHNQNGIGYLLAAASGRSSTAAELLAAVCAGEALVSLAVTEEDETVNPAQFNCAATEDLGRFRLNGRKAFVVGGPLANQLIVAARIDGPHSAGAGELGLFVVDPGAVGVTVRPMSVAGTDKQADVKFSDVALTQDALLCRGEAAEQALRACTDHWLALQLADLIGVGHEIVEMTVRHVRRRTAFSTVVGTFQAVQHTMADMLIKLECSRELAYEAIATLSEFGQATTELARAGSFVLESIKEIAFAAHQLHGGIGYTLEHNLHLYTGRARSAEVMFGRPADHRTTLARQIGLAW
jgi:alkylation response protein AidB-like acyl-CoA dehydrogenase